MGDKSETCQTFSFSSSISNIDAAATTAGRWRCRASCAVCFSLVDGNRKEVATTVVELRCCGFGGGLSTNSTLPWMRDAISVPPSAIAPSSASWLLTVSLPPVMKAATAECDNGSTTIDVANKSNDILRSKDILRKQTALKGERKVPVLIGISVAFSLHVISIYWWYQNDDLMYPLVMLPPREIPPFWHAIFIIMVNDVFPPHL
ncbi:hypothetical protein PIB30_068599 [Stylosanthes scabra]|uniref:Uncharacterized protein n=1 Tax=Stylosanthes scabra TaxID=79078 RepID=A0ABU6VLE4_9FABA|nr:hypothetical protein [Stylosanthes scabra]